MKQRLFHQHHMQKQVRVVNDFKTEVNNLTHCFSTRLALFEAFAEACLTGITLILLVLADFISNLFRLFNNEFNLNNFLNLIKFIFPEHSSSVLTIKLKLFPTAHVVRSC